VNTPQVLMIPVGELFPCTSQPRKSLSREELGRMAASIKVKGVLQPIRARRDELRNGWEIVTGETRWRGAKEAGLATVPCLPVIGDLSETDLLADQLIENVCRNDLAPVQLARGLARYKALRQCTAQQMATELGISGSAISKSESLLSLPEDVQALVDGGQVSESAAYHLSRLPDEATQRELAQAIAAGTINRDDAAEAVQAAIGKKNVTPKGGRLPLKLEGGVCVTVSAGQPLTWDDFNTALDVIRKQAKKLHDGGKPLADLPRSLRAS
jgi:ParB family transcriptional regulator, chromosome partitioning protein